MLPLSPVRSTAFIQLLIVASTLILPSDLNMYTISYDDGTPEEFFYRPASSCGEIWYVIMFTVPCKAKLFSIILYINNSWPFYLSIFRKPPSGAWKRIVNEMRESWWRNQPYKPSRPGWVHVNLSAYNIWVEGDFYIALKPVMNYTLIDNLGLGLDKSGRPSGRSFLWYRCMMGFSIVDGNFMVRARVGLTCKPPENQNKLATAKADTVMGLLSSGKLYVWGGEADVEAVNIIAGGLGCTISEQPSPIENGTLISLGGPISNPSAKMLNPAIGVNFSISESGISLMYEGHTWSIPRHMLWAEDYAIIRAYTDNRTRIVLIEGCTRLGTTAASYYLVYNKILIEDARTVIVRWIDTTGDGKVQIFECAKIWSEG